MSCICIILFIILVTFPSPLKAEENTVIHHEMKIVLYPEERRFHAEDSIAVPETFPSEFIFFLYEGLAVTMEEKEKAYQTEAVMNDKSLELTIHLP
jgi:hypothetical protein